MVHAKLAGVKRFSFLAMVVLIGFCDFACLAVFAQTPLQKKGIALGGLGTGALFLDEKGSVQEAQVGEDETSLHRISTGFVGFRVRIGEESHAYTFTTERVKDLPYLQHIDATLRFPMAHFVVPREVSPIATDLLVFSSIIPHDIPNSTLPATAFVISFHNPLPIATEVSAVISFPSLFPSAQQGEVVPAADGFFGATMKSPQGETAVLAYPQSAAATVTVACWEMDNPTVQWWPHFAQTGDVSGPQRVVNAKMPAVAIAVRVTLAPHDHIEIPFAVAWEASNRTRFYHALFPSAYAAARHLLSGWLMLYALTAEWEDYLSQSNLPPHVITEAEDGLQPLLTLCRLDSEGVVHFEERASLPQRIAIALPLLDLYPDLVARMLQKEQSFPREKGGELDEAEGWLLLAAAYCVRTGNLVPLQLAKESFHRALGVVVQREKAMDGLWDWASLRAGEAIAAELGEEPLAKELAEAFAKATQTLPKTLAFIFQGTEQSARLVEDLAILMALEPSLSLPPELSQHVQILLTKANQYPALAPPFAYLMIEFGQSREGLALVRRNFGAMGALNCLYWEVVNALAGFQADLSRGVITLLPRIPGDWPRYGGPIFASSLWASLHYTPTARGEYIRFVIERLFAPGPIDYPASPVLLAKLPAPHLSVKQLLLPAVAQFPGLKLKAPPEVHISLNDRPLGYRVESISPSTLRIEFDTPLLLTSGDRLLVEVH